LNTKDVGLIRELAVQVAEIAALPVQEEKRTLWRKLNAREPARPMVLIDQVCWNEMNHDGSLTLQCEDEECRGYEERLRRTLYKWRHFPVDMVVDPFVRISKAIRNTGFGIQVREERAVGDPTNTVVGHKYENQFETEADLEKIQTPRISHDAAETDRRLAVAHELFDGLLEVRPSGTEIGMALWDAIAQWMGVENALYALADRPDYMHRLMSRLTDGTLSMIDQLEEQGLWCEPQSLIHCTGAYTDELPAPGYNPRAPRAKDIWVCGMAQMFSTVSPAMFKEFEADYIRRIAARFGLVYYGCCEPLDGMMAAVRSIPNVRKVSMSPWANQERGAAEIGGDYVFSRKPSPALVATDRFHPEQVREDLATTRKICEKHGCPLEFILKDISTVRYEPQRLAEWGRIAMEVAGG
jgi:hypothetical protein